MSRATSRVTTRWWTDNEFLHLHPDAQRVLFLLWTSPETALCGLTSISPASIAERLRLTPGAVRSRLAELEDRDFIKRDPDAPLCWIKSYVEAQLGGMPSSSKPWLTNTTTAVAGLPQTAMVKEFKAAYGLPDHFPKRGKKEGSPRGPRRDPDKGPAGGYARGAPIRSLGIGVGVGVAPAADPTDQTGIEADTVLPSIAGGRRA